jgi:hypothetical protein
MQKTRKRRPLGCFIIDFGRLEKACQAQQKSVESVLHRIDVSHHTIDNIRKGRPVRPGTVASLEEELGEQFTDRYARRIGAEDAPLEVMAADKQLGEWMEPKVLTKWIPTTNGLQYRVLKMRHQDVTASFARVKCYELADLSDDERRRIRHLLLRHPTVCRQLPVSPRIAVNERTFQDSTGNYWWVIDRWVDGPFLSEVVAKETWPLVEILRIGREMAEGLNLLHEHSIIRRDLSPQFVLLASPNRSVMLTDFELAKLLDAGPTVSKDWPTDPYRAPEVGDGNVDARADIYSWGRIVTQMALGVLPPVGKDREQLRRSPLPEELKELLRRCVALPRSDRPRAVPDVLKVLDSLS